MGVFLRARGFSERRQVKGTVLRGFVPQLLLFFLHLVVVQCHFQPLKLFKVTAVGQQPEVCCIEALLDLLFKMFFGTIFLHFFVPDPVTFFSEVNAGGARAQYFTR